jgi:glycolate oxidase iron-sulfur subunit
VEARLAHAGFDVATVRDAHLCCGSAGTYSLLHPAISQELRARKLASLRESRPDCIVTANIGCLSHLQPAAGVPVRHWIELLDASLARKIP